MEYSVAVSDTLSYFWISISNEKTVKSLNLVFSILSDKLVFFPFYIELSVIYIYTHIYLRYFLWLSNSIYICGGENKYDSKTSS